MKTNRHCFSLDLKNDSELISAYKAHHKNVWPDIIKSIKDNGILSLDIYLVENRLFMIMEVSDAFSFENKNIMDFKNSKVQEWETLMWKYQQALPMTKPNEKWRLMEQIFQLD
tara:strand:- start:1320 stop:1658 length:339 start_codon:yes stop_codon:yes gene_type:complete